MNSETTTSKLYVNTHQELIDGCRRGDQKSQFQIYKLYYKAMYNTSLRIVNNTQEAEDIMQESFLLAFEKIETWSGTVSFGAWLKKIVQNLSIDYYRKKQRVVFEDIEKYHEVEELVYFPVPEEDPDPRINRIAGAIKSLPEKCRNILSLSLYEGYDNEEISKILSIPGSTARSQLFRAKKMVLREMEGHQVQHRNNTF